jgi:sulfotransferase family protein
VSDIVNSSPRAKQLGFVRAARNGLRAKFFAILRHIASIDDGREILTRFLLEQNAHRFPAVPSCAAMVEAPYPDLDWREERLCTPLRSDIIFVTGRFRSGSTLLWNIFRSIEGITAYYEPFNERRWFDPSTRGARVDKTHLNVREYWSEYDGLVGLDEHYSEEWTRRQLYMDEHSWNPAMQRYVEVLVESAQGRPVLQFNRVDMRLAWLRSRFPNAKLLHIFRHPRDQWCSTLPASLHNGQALTLRDFEPLDGFYLLPWARDLINYFPFLSLHEDTHPYELFYQIWKLSYLFGRAYCHASVCFERLVQTPDTAIREILEAVSIIGVDPEALARLVEPVAFGKWKAFAHSSWFEAIEERAEAAFRDFIRCPTSSAQMSTLLPGDEKCA